MQKTQAMASLGQHRLMLPAWVKAALAANDRLKVYLTVLQTAASHASHPRREPPDLAREAAAAGLNGAWLHEVVTVARRAGDALLVPDLPRLVACLGDDLAIMARPVLETTPAGAQPHPRVKQRLDWLRALPADRLRDRQVEELTMIFATPESAGTAGSLRTTRRLAAVAAVAPAAASARGAPGWRSRRAPLVA